MFKHKAFAATAVAFLIAAAPASAAKADGTGEVALHIEAEAAIPPDRAEMTLSLTGKGTTREAALSDLHAKHAAIKSSLAGVGIGADKVKLLEPGKNETVAVDDAADAMASAIAETAPPNDGTKHRMRPAPAPMIGVSADMLITLDDLTKLAGLQTAARANNVETYRLNYGGRFFSSDPAAAGKRAREQAIANARTEADAYAAALGYPKVIYSLGHSLFHGRGVACDKARGIALFKQAAELGLAAAQLAFGREAFGNRDWQRYQW